MNRIIAFTIVAVIGFIIMSYDTTKPGCFAWCDVGKGLLMWSIAEGVMFTVKGPSMAVRMTGGAPDPDLDWWKEPSQSPSGGFKGGSIMSHVVKK